MTPSITPANKLTIFTGLFITLVLFVICLVGPRLLNSSAHLNLDISTTFLISRLLLWCLLIVVCLYSVKVEMHPLLIWQEQKYGISFYLLSIIILLLSILIGGILISQLVIFFKVNHQSSALTILTNLGVPLKLFAVVTAAVVEESIFRGYLMPRLQIYLKNRWLTIIVSAIIFGLAHLGYGTISNILVPVFVGLAFGFHYYKYKNLKVLIICHALIDFYALIIQH